MTKRLILRTVTMEDTDTVASSWKLDEGPIPLQEAKKKITWMLANHEQNVSGRLVHLCLAIIHKHTREFIGWCGLDHLDQRKVNPVLFYLIKMRYWGKGLATEAAKAVVDYAFNKLDLAGIDGAASYENIASKRVMEKIGMRYQGLDDEGGHFFTLNKDEYDF
ncbi:MAG: GNAT family N-acetyltransferase [Candidatus Cloacimonetes bacterium]|nr:GNAT family N-acetyltransferase [Candidatus Cloacimonadota bacterium]